MILPCDQGAGQTAVLQYRFKITNCLNVNMILAALGKLREIHVQLRNDKKLIKIGPRDQMSTVK